MEERGPAQPEAPVLRVRNLFFSYGATPVLRGVDLEVGEGEMVGLVGPNGSGKSTLLKLASRVLTAADGSILLGGQDVRALSPREMARQVAVVAQTPVLPESFTVLEMVLLGRTPHLGLLQNEGPRDLASALRALEMTGSRELAERRLGELSGGEQQRVVVARALAQETPLLLLDEPTAHLDVGYQTALLDTVRGLLRKSAGRLLAVLAAIHDLTLAAQYCDRLVLLHEGRVVAQGPPERVLTPELISQVYATEVAVVKHPRGGPAVLPVAKPR